MHDSKYNKKKPIKKSKRSIIINKTSTLQKIVCKLPRSPMAICLQKMCVVFISFFVVFFPCPAISLSPRLMSNRYLSYESDALLRFKAALNYSSEGLNYSSGSRLGSPLSSWVNGTDCCSMWKGISCDNHTNHVVSLDLSDPDFKGTYYGVISESLCQLRFLRSLKIQGVTELSLHGNMLNGLIPSCLGNLSSLRKLHLSDNQLSGSIPSSLGNLSSLSHLQLSGNKLSGSIPDFLGNISSLHFLDLSKNQISGSIPDSLGSLSLLWGLLLGGNQLRGIIPHSLGNLSLVNHLDISNNNLTGTIPPSFSRLSSLTDFYGHGNHFNETIFPSSLPHSLESVSLSLNQSIQETFFNNLTNLALLYLFDCVLNINKTWIPPFQLYDLHLVSCTIDGEVPPWLSTQFLLHTLKLVNTGLVGQIPSWLCETNPLLNSLNLSGNHLEGNLFFITSMDLEMLDVSRNELSGPIPSMLPPNMWILLLNNNLFSGNIPSSLGKLSQLVLLNLANNNLTGVIPVSLAECSYLLGLNLGNNSLQGSLPREFSKLGELYSLVVHSNNLNGSLPSSISNCSNLQVLDIGNNSFEGEIPSSLKNLSKLRVLVMKENNFIGTIPPELGQLMNLQILLLSSNHISGSIPRTIALLQAMAIENQDGFVISTNLELKLNQNQFFIVSNTPYQEGLDMNLKGTLEHYKYIFSTLTSIDLSHNELEGEIDPNLGNLKGLRLLNLSMNNLKGTIPNSLAEMSQLESLDLSGNHFSGQIPIEIGFLNFLGSLNLSNNNLSGSIPQGQHITSTFGESSFSGNPNLWGCPLPKKCSWPQFVAPPPTSINKGKKSIGYPWYKISMGLSYGVAFGGLISLIMIKISWRRKYFNKVDTILKFLFPWMKNWTL